MHFSGALMMPGRLFVVLMLSSMFASSIAADEPKSSPHGPDQSEKYGYPWMKGIEYEEFGPNGIVVRVKADSLSLVPRRILFFNIKSINEIQVENAEIDVYLYEDSAQRLDLLPLSDEPFRLPNRKRSKKSYGVITRSVLNGIFVRIFRLDEEILSLTAERATVQDKDSNPEFSRVRLESAISGRQIVSDRILWDADRKLFLIPGPYNAVTPEGQASGSNIAIDLDFNVSSL
jgi:hypothetical protein